MSGYEKNNFFNRLAVKYQFTNHFRSRYYCYPGTENSTSIDEGNGEKSDDDIFDASKSYSDTMDTFGVDVSASTAANAQTGKTIVQAKPGAPTNVSNASVTAESDQEEVGDSADSDSSEGLMIDLDGESPTKEQPNLAKKEDIKDNMKNDRQTESDSNASLRSGAGSPSKKKKGNPTKELESANSAGAIKATATQDSNILGAILMEQEKLIQKTTKKTSKENTGNLENPKMYVQPPADQNFSYKTWLLKGNQKAYRLLVRSSVDTAVVSESLNSPRVS